VEHEYFGDYGNLSLTVDLSGSSLARLLAGSQLPASLPSTSKHRAGNSSTHRAGNRKAAGNSLASITRWASGSTVRDLLTGAMR
jgi:hypothetical protein